MKAAVSGIGYVGLPNAVLPAQPNAVISVDLSAEPVAWMSAPIPLLKGTDFAVTAAPTGYDPETDFYDSSSVERVMAQTVAENPSTQIVVKSTLRGGFVNRTREKLIDLRPNAR